MVSVRNSRSKRRRNIVVADLKSDIIKQCKKLKLKILKLFFIDCDVSSYTEIQLTIETISLFGTLDAVNNTGIGSGLSLYK
jgi:cytidylate kinase